MVILDRQDTLLQARAENPDAFILLPKEDAVEIYAPQSDIPMYVLRGWHRWIRAKLFVWQKEMAP